MRLSQVASADELEIVRDGEFRTLGFLSDPQAGMLTFVESPRYLAAVARGAPAAVLTTPALRSALVEALVGGGEDDTGLAICAEPRRAFFRLHNRLAAGGFYWDDFPTAIDPTARIHPSAIVAARNVRIGARTVVEPRVVIAERSIVGADCVLRAGAVLGSVGFQVLRLDGAVIDMTHGGGVELEDEVHVLANAVVAAAVFRQSTRIGCGSRIGNLAFVSHNVQIGRRCLIGHNAVVNGNVRIGDEAWIGPGAALAHCITIGERAKVSLGSAVIGDVAAGEQVTGNVAIAHRRFLRHLAR